MGAGLAVGLAFWAAVLGPDLGARSAPPSGAIVAERVIAFQDRADGAVVAMSGGAEIAVFQGEQGFLRGILRSLARGRRGEGLTGAAPFRLVAWADGRVTLDDMANGARVELEAFGTTNVAVFTGLLAAKPASLASK